MKIIGVIPARYGSTRFPGKPLALLQGRPMIQWTIEGARKSKLLSELIVATDDERIQQAAEAVGVRVQMTSSDLATGSDRIFAAIKDQDADVIVNIQGDEPLVSGELVDRLAQVFKDEPSLDMATLAQELAEGELASVNAVKVILNHRDEAIYFSRFGIPYSRGSQADVGTGAWKHIGMYAYSKKFLQKFCECPPTIIERAESLEQLRALYLGAKIKVIRVKEASLGVDTPEDLARLEKILKSGETHG